MREAPAAGTRGAPEYQRVRPQHGQKPQTATARAAVRRLEDGGEVQMGGISGHDTSTRHVTGAYQGRRSRRCTSSPFRNLQPECRGLFPELVPHPRVGGMVDELGDLIVLGSAEEFRRALIGDDSRGLERCDRLFDHRNDR